ncbi:hypothetical protein DSO57_1035331 [Entomophthora muscae]|uniref:Uncharacterized protein n=2 Tax=Entomophthora muscae TaxID=34485 RepID=A0ACC2U8X8_9FUNG|nr:hypothetical protein DSO57_1035705 [Entomophthora muscae]KAJ9083374.1 hypothetical protein DSO57_1035331 [Entomophthora muscae]
MESEKEVAQRFKAALEVINYSVNWLSVIAALVVVGMILGAMSVNRKAMDQVSIRITAAICTLDVFKSLGNMYLQHAYVYLWGCVLAEAIVKWLMMTYLLLNICLAANIHMVFINEIPFSPKWERVYWAVSFGLPSLLFLVPIGICILR